mmetsp:Transcript_5646/g.21260  ORF Transcript_5646/g.21260 Transcript_5646/m.21260 type:complete len:1105 (-) Transcript_5646:57-3371(-)|eukprot:CAMPEP_0117444532 /NCGR_PEP_ID=MMETSP0759-20121206/5292_1 /TAXON_ID=63605 /ORGANISM="Percolomonas cosmopolitus, Strain WS" /LENGTH=1104 /DNA_ID=CAMNT_0005236607 /DNA_START=124 /DNA_END=3438 /DNA_ORIENTATION=+
MKRRSTAPLQGETKRAKTHPVDEDDDTLEVDEMEDIEEDVEVASPDAALQGDEEDEEDSGVQIDEEVEVQMTDVKWERPDFDPNFDPANQSLFFQQIEADYTTMNRKEGYPDANVPHVPVVRCYGVTESGHSVMCYIRGYIPYFYIEMPANFNPTMCNDFKTLLNRRMNDNSSKPLADGMEWVVQVSIEQKMSIMYYQFEQKKNFLRISTGQPFYVPRLRKLFEMGIGIPGIRNGVPQQYMTYESNVLFVLRTMIDSEIVGGSWIELPAGKYNIVPRKDTTSHCQIEVEVSCNDLVALPSEGKWIKLAPFRILSFDIECAGRDGHFPQPDEDPVIQIANYVTCQGDTKPLLKNIFVLGTCADIAGAQVLSFQSERELLTAWRDFVITIDPDILTGYNITNFDLYYLIKRAQTLKVNGFGLLGRIRNEKSTIKKNTLSSKQMGARESNDVTIRGRVQIDVMLAIRLNYKLSSYTLNNVSAHFLGEQKEDVHHSIISKLHNGTDEERKRLAVYCLKDAYLPQRLLDKLMIIVNYVEMARVTGIPLSFILQRGQQIKVVSQLLRHCKKEGFLMPTPSSMPKNETYVGGHVIQPKAGYYEKPIATLDFASLYPSIMIAHNLCYTSWISKDIYDKGILSDADVVRTPTGHYFVKAEKYKGLLPRILEHLLQARSRAKSDLKKATDPMEKAVLNGRQLALKISANSVYGFTGATAGRLPCFAISGSVTAFGRDMILDTKDFVEKTYTMERGYPFDAEVVYGDTDSVMVKFGELADIGEAMKYGKEAAKEITAKLFKVPIKLEFEKVYTPYLLLSKKRYAGLLYTQPETHDYLDMKGIETVRRDNCMLVRNTIDTCLRLLLIKKDKQKSINYAKQVIEDLKRNRIDLSMLIISKSISRKLSDYKVRQPHVELAKRMMKRDPSSAPRLGDRVPYVIVQKSKGAKLFEKSEDPIYALEHSVPLDVEHYLTRMLHRPLKDIFTPVMKNVDEIFSGSHTKYVVQMTPKNTGLMKFAKKLPTCLGCRTRLKDNSSPLCKHCMDKEADIYEKILDERNYYENVFSRVWTCCQRCQGSLHQEVLCTNKDCPVFYMRKKVAVDLQRTTDKLSRFESLEW